MTFPAWTWSLKRGALFDEVTRVMTAGGEEALDAATVLMDRHDMIVPPGTRPAYRALTPPDPSSA